MPVKNKQNKQEVKIKNDKTAMQEQCSVVAIYYYMTKNMDDQKNKDELIEQFKIIWPDIVKAKDGVQWENTFLEQGQTFASSNYYSGKDYNYGWWDAPTQAVNSTKFAKAIDNNTTTVLTQMWNMFDKQKIQVGLFGNQKDSWNTADMYLVKKGRGPEMIKWVKELKEEFIGGLCCDPGVFVGTVNTYLTKLIHQKLLIPISLKKQTKGRDIKILETNMHEWGESGKIDIVKANFETQAGNPGPWAYFNVIKDGSEITFGNPKGRGGNSFQYFAKFKVGDYDTKYLVEQRLAGKKTKAEVKEIVLTNKGKETRAAAQTGQVPQPEFEKLLEQYTGENYDYNVPEISEPFSEPQIKYWKKYLKDVNDDNSIPLNLNGFEVLGTQYSIDDWLEKVIQIDNDYLRDTTGAIQKYGNLVVGNFHSELRMKMKQLRFARAMQKSKKNISEIIVHIYYLAAKQNVSEGDIHGPFLKIY